MKHASDATLNQIEPQLDAIRQHYLPPLNEKKQGTFYLKSSAFLHFHEDPAGIFADLKVAGDWERYPVNQPNEWDELMGAIALHLPKT